MKIYKNNYEGYIFLLLAQFMVGVSIVGFKVLLQSTPEVIILITRFTIGFLFLLVLHWIFKGKFSTLKSLTRTDWLFIIAEALCAGALFNILLLSGLHYTSASVAGIITSALPAIVAIFSIVFLKEHMTLSIGLCIVFAILGLMIINIYSLHFDSANQIIGDILILLALLPEATYYILTKFHPNKLPVLLVSALITGINIPIFLFLALFQHHTFYSVISMAQILLLLMVGISSALFFAFWFLGCKKIRGTAAGLTATFMPITTLALSYLFLNETLSILQSFGMLLVILSIVFNARRSLNCQ